MPIGPLLYCPPRHTFHSTLHRMSRFIPALLTCLLIFSVVNYFPLSTESEAVVGADGDTITVPLSADTPITQSILATGHAITGLSIFSPDLAASVRGLHVSLLDESGHVVAKSYRVQRTATNDRLAIRWFIPPLATYAGQSLRIQITSSAQQSIAIVAHSEDTYANGELKVPATPGTDLSFTVHHPSPTTFGTKQGIALGLVILLLATWWGERIRTNWWPSIVMCLFIATFLSWPFWFSTGNWGIDDWDYRFSLHESYRQSILQYHQFPFWNPYVCGGSAALADPEFSLLSVTFIPELLFGVVTGIRVSIWLCLALTSLGTLFLSRRLQLSPLAGCLAAIVVTASSGLILKLVEGHETIVFAFMWVPWILGAWVTAYRVQQITWSGTLLTGIFLALTFYQGGIYILSYLAVAFFGLIILVRRPVEALKTTLMAAVWAAGLSAFKLLPVVWWLKEFPDRDFVGSTSTWSYLSAIFLGRYLHGATVLPHQVSGWHEYGAYIGPIVALLSLIGLVSGWRTRLTRILAIAGLTAIILSAAGPALEPIFQKIPFIPRSNVSRLAFIAVVPLSLLAGQGLEQLSRTRWHLVPPLLVGLVAVDLLSLAYPIAEQAFVAPLVVPQIAPAPQPLGFTSEDYTFPIEQRESPRAYQARVAGYSTFSFCSVIGPVPAVTPNDLQPYASLSVPNGEVKVTSWTPNVVTLSYTTPQISQLVIKTNFASGWVANGQPAIPVDGQVGTTVPAGTGSVVFSYHPMWYQLGLVITTLIVLLAAILWDKHQKGLHEHLVTNRLNLRRYVSGWSRSDTNRPEV